MNAGDHHTSISHFPEVADPIVLATNELRVGRLPLLRRPAVLLEVAELPVAILKYVARPCTGDKMRCQTLARQCEQ